MTKTDVIPILLITFYDHVYFEDQITHEELRKDPLGPCLCRVVGMKLYEDEKIIHLAMNQYNLKTDPVKYEHRFIISKPSIIDIKELAEIHVENNGEECVSITVHTREA